MKTFKDSRSILFILTILCSVQMLSCQGGSIAGNENGSEPINEIEGYEYQKAVNRCHRTGGTRVVKIKGELKCY